MSHSGGVMPRRKEFDLPPRRMPAPLIWAIAVTVATGAVIVLAGLLGGVGPLKALGAVETSLMPTAWRATPDPSILRIAVNVPTSGLCPSDEVRVSSIERSGVIEVSATRVQPRSELGCSGQAVAGARVWLDLRLDAPLGTQQVVRAGDRVPLVQEGSA